MTATAVRTDEIVLEIHKDLAGSIGNYNVYVCDDGGGPYLSLNNPANEEDYRCLSLAEESCSDDLTLYRWNFWNSTANVWLNSELGYNAPVEDVLDFLTECLAEEDRILTAAA